MYNNHLCNLFTTSTQYVSDKETGETTFTSRRPFCLKAVMWLCGVDHRVKNDRLPAKHKVQQGDHEFLMQKPSEARLVNTFAVLIIAAAVFLLVFYA